MGEVYSVSEANRLRKWDREEVVILVTEYFRSKKWTNENIVENQKEISRFLKKREQMITGMIPEEIFRNYAGICMQYGNVRCLDPETPYYGMHGSKLQKQIVQEYLEDPNALEVEAALIYQKYGEDEE